MKRPNRLRRTAVAVATALVVTTATACSTATPGVIPGVGSGGTYSIDIEFGNVLNLPTGAPVIADGVRVGALRDLTVEDGFVRAHVDIDADVVLPQQTSAMLRQAAPLADVHIALDTGPVADAGSATALQAGDTIEIANTSAAPQIEDTLAGLATAVGNGTFTNFMVTVRNLNRAFPDDISRTSAMFEVIGRDLEDIAAHTEAVDSILDGLDATASVVIDERDKIAPLLTADGVEHTTQAMASILGILFILTDLGQIAPPAQWLAPVLGGADKALTAVVPTLFGSSPLDTSNPSNMRTLLDVINEELPAWVAGGAKTEITGLTVTGSHTRLSSDENARQMVAVMRMIGLVR